MIKQVIEKVIHRDNPFYYHFNHILKNNKGLTLVEVLISAILLTMTAIGVMGVFTSGYLVLQRQVAFHRATELARDKLEQVQNMPLEDVLPADEEQDHSCRDGYVETKIIDGINGALTAQDFGGATKRPGSDVVIFCPVCGYPNKLYKAAYYEFYYEGDPFTATTRIYVDAPEAAGEEIFTAYNSFKDLFANETIRCKNNDKNNDGVSAPFNPTTHRCDAANPDCCDYPLQGPDNLGYYERFVRVHAYKENAIDDYDFGAAGGVGVDIKGAYAPVKEITVTIKWKALKEEQEFSLSTIATLIIPKYGFKELGR